MATITGAITVGKLNIYSVDVPPDTAPGLAAPKGSLALMEDGNGLFFKTGIGDTDWVRILTA